MRRALEGVKLVGFVNAVVGTATLKPFAEHGAVTVRVESMKRPCGLRVYSPYKDGKPGINRSIFYAFCNNDRLSMALNLQHPRAGELVRRLVRWADVVVENYAPGQMSKWGLGYENLKQINPGIITMSASMVGQTGPHRDSRGYGTMLQVYAGFPSITGYSEGRPLVVGSTPPDFIAPVLGAVAVLAALDYRDRTGRGQYIDLSELEASILGFAPALLDYSVNRRVMRGQGNQCAYAAPHNVYRCKGDNRWCAIAVFTDEEWRALCRIIGSPAWTAEERFQTLMGRKAHEADLDGLVQEWTAQRTAEEVMETMQAGGVAAGVVRNVKDVFECPQAKHRHVFWTLEHPEIGPQPYMSLAAILSKTPRELKRAAPCIGEHTERVCRELLGVPESEYVSLLLDDVFE